MTLDPKIYEFIMRKEAQLADKDWRYPPDIETAWRLVCLLEETIKNAFVVRVCSKKPFRPDSPRFVPETDSAHVSIVRKLIDMYLSYTFGPELDRNNIPGGYSYREVIEAVERHDLRENVTGDGADNGKRSEPEKLKEDVKFWGSYSKLAPGYEIDFEQRINKLLLEFSHQSSELGRALYCADKVSAILTCLYLDQAAKDPPALSIHSRYATVLDKEEMQVCRQTNSVFCKASEMWTVDFLKLRHRIDFDDTGFFTAILVMYTLIVHKTWYSWRIHDYEEAEAQKNAKNQDEAE